MNIQRILCPVDFSTTSAHSIDQAVAIAGWYKARITALHVYSPILLSVPGAWTSRAGAAGDELVTRRLREETAAHCEAATAAGIGLDIVVDVGQPIDHILRCARSLPAGLIVMGTHGTGGFAHLVLGSVAEKVVRKASCPVLTVPPRAHATSRLPFGRVLCAVDFSECSLAALALALSLARESNAVLTILHVIEWPWPDPTHISVDELPPLQGFALDEFRRYSEQSAGTRLASLVPEAIRESRPIAPRIGHGKAYVEILRAAAGEQADLIVIGVHGHKPLHVNLFGSTVNQVVRHATCPVLTVR